MKAKETVNNTISNWAGLSHVSDEALYSMIAGVEAEIKRLSAIEAKPAKLLATIEQLHLAVAHLSNYVDNR